MRTTVTLDDDVAAKVQAEARRYGRPFRQVLNETLRRGLEAKRAGQPRSPFRVVARDLGRLSPGVNLDNIGELIESIEGPQAR